MEIGTVKFDIDRLWLLFQAIDDKGMYVCYVEPDRLGVDTSKLDSCEEPIFAEFKRQEKDIIVAAQEAVDDARKRGISPTTSKNPLGIWYGL